MGKVLQCFERGIQLAPHPTLKIKRRIRLLTKLAGLACREDLAFIIHTNVRCTGV